MRSCRDQLTGIQVTEFANFPTVGSIAQKVVLRATLDMTVRAVSDLMDQHNVSSVLIEKNAERYVFSVEDLLEHLQAGKKYSAALAEVKINKISCVLESEHILEAMETIENSGKRYLGVIDANNQLTGILTYTDILSAVDPTILVQKKTIGELVSRTEPVTFTADWILEDVLSHLRKMEDSIIVVESGAPIGIITTKDIFKIISSDQRADKPLSDYMVSPVITTCVSSTIHEALSQLKQFRIKRSIVVNESHQLVGVVTQSQLVGFAYGAWIELVKHHTSELKELVGILEAKAVGFEKHSLTDPLTGLGNRRMLEKRLRTEIERIRRYHSPTFSLLLLNVDGFTRINDQFGRMQSDEILKAIGFKLTELIKTTDDVIRWDKETFAILLPYKSIAVASELATLLRKTLENFSFVNGVKITVSLSVGQYSLTENETTFFDRIYKVLVCAKSQGRNQVVIDFDSNVIPESC